MRLVGASVFVHRTAKTTMRIASLPLVLAAIVAAGPALAEDPPNASSVVILRGSSAPPTPWYEPPPEPKITIQTVYLPYYYYLPPAYGAFIDRRWPLPPVARRNR